MKGQAQELYAKSHGVNFEDMQGLTVLMQAATMSAAGAEGTDRGRQALSAVVEMALRKGQKYDLELPPGAVEVMTEATTRVDKKKGVM